MKKKKQIKNTFNDDLMKFKEIVDLRLSQNEIDKIISKLKWDRFHIRFDDQTLDRMFDIILKAY